MNMCIAKISILSNAKTYISFFLSPNTRALSYRDYISYSPLSSQTTP